MSQSAALKCLDRYGFPLAGLTAAEQAVRTEAAARETKLQEKWSRQTITWQPLSNTPPPSKLKQLVREGIPLSCRPALWYQLSGAAALRRTEPAEYYISLASLGKVSSTGNPELSLDLFRTFSNHLALSSHKALEAIRRIVTAFGKRNESVAYSQNINFVVAFLLVVMGTAKEEEVFWTLAALLERRLPASSVVEGSSGLNVEQRMFDVLVERKHPRLIEVFDRLECSLGGLTGEWFSRMFTTALPAETAARVWDCVMVEGPKVLFRAALSLIKMNEPALLNTCHSVQVSRILKWRVARTYQADMLLKIGFKSIGTLKTDMLHQLRIAQQAALSVEVAAHKKRLEDILCTNAAARASKATGKSDNPLAKALGQCKGQSLPVPIHGYATSKLTTILESPIEMWGEDY
ncbi:hypothetical protein ABBQ38_008775 [Trebouxia sp. C0009 RCD-2024]